MHYDFIYPVNVEKFFNKEYVETYFNWRIPKKNKGNFDEAIEKVLTN